MCRRRGAHGRGDGVVLLRRDKRGSRKAPDVNAVWGRALDAALSDDLESADSHLTTLVQDQDPGPEVYRLLGRVARERGDVRRAVQIHQALVLRRDLSAADRIDSLNELGRSLESSGEFDRALAAHHEVLAHDRHNRIALEAAERMLSQRGDLEAAWALKKRRGRVEGFRDRLGEAELLCAIADSSLVLGERRRAKRAMGRALRASPTLAAAWKLKAQHGRRSRRALKSWGRWLENELEPNPEDLAEAEVAFTNAGRAKEWLQALKAQIEKRPAEPALWRALGRGLAGSGGSDSRETVGRLIEKLSDRDSAMRALQSVLVETDVDDMEVISRYCDWIDRCSDDGRGSEPAVQEKD